MYFTGIDIGSTASKVVVVDENGLVEYFVVPTGWNSKETANAVAERLASSGRCVGELNRVVATGYGRVSVEYASRMVTEITCHARGAYTLLGRDCTVIDIGGQDTKIITAENGMASTFLMNDKCSAGTGKFLEIMSSRLGVTLGELFDLAAEGQPLAISAMCTVFAESEVISHIGSGKKRADIAAGVVDSVVSRVVGMCSRYSIRGDLVLTGGLCDSAYMVNQLSLKLRQPVYSHAMGRYAGALGAALIARGRKARDDDMHL